MNDLQKISKSSHNSKIIMIREFILGWGKLNLRKFPWRDTTEPYCVFISEIMLHRTRADQVLPVYEMFINTYPDFDSICKAGVKQISSEMDSLGLKWRSEGLYRAACLIVRKYEGVLPGNKNLLLEIPGIGPYIASAIMNFAYDQPEPLLDTNTVRIIGRIFGYEITDSSRRSSLYEDIMRDLVNFDSHKLFLWSMIDFASIICKKRSPLCFDCPINQICHYYQEVYRDEKENNGRNDQ